MRSLLLVWLLSLSLFASADELTPTPAPKTLAPTVFIPTCQDIKVFKDKAHAAIDAALKYPAELKFRPTSGVTIVAYDYADRKVSNVRITQLSGDGRLDRAALNAVKDADYASITPDIGDQKFHDVVIIVFDNSANADKNAAEPPKRKDPATQTCS